MDSLPQRVAVEARGAVQVTWGAELIEEGRQTRKAIGSGRQSSARVDIAEPVGEERSDRCSEGDTREWTEPEAP